MTTDTKQHQPPGAPDAAEDGIAQSTALRDMLLPDGKHILDPEKRFTGLWMGLLPTGLAYGGLVRLMSDVSYRTRRGEVSTVRAGFWFGTSTPAVVRWWLPCLGDGRNAYAVAAAWHDWLYFHRRIGGREIARREADDLFLEIMRYLGVGSVLARTMWAGVRCGGLFGWNRKG